MALTKIVTKQPVSKLSNNLFEISMNLILSDGGVEVIKKNYHIRHRIGDGVGDKKGQLIDKMQADIDKYKEERQVYNSAQLDAAVIDVQETLEV